MNPSFKLPDVASRIYDDANRAALHELMRDAGDASWRDVERRTLTVNDLVLGDILDPLDEAVEVCLGSVDDHTRARDKLLAFQAQHGHIPALVAQADSLIQPILQVWEWEYLADVEESDSVNHILERIYSPLAELEAHRETLNGTEMRWRVWGAGIEHGFGAFGVDDSGTILTRDYEHEAEEQLSRYEKDLLTEWNWFVSDVDMESMQSAEVDIPAHVIPELIIPLLQRVEARGSIRDETDDLEEAAADAKQEIEEVLSPLKAVAEALSPLIGRDIEVCALGLDPIELGTWYHQVLALPTVDVWQKQQSQSSDTSYATEDKRI